MKGIIFNLLEEYIEKNLGEGKYEEIMERCILNGKGPFIGPGTYPDDDFMAIVGGTVKEAGIPMPIALRSFGEFCFHRLAEKYPDFVNPYTHPKPFLKSVESIVHVEVKKLYEGSNPPGFSYIDSVSDRLVIQYSSGRMLCQFMEGLIDGVAGHYQFPINYKQTACMLDGDGICEFDISFLPWWVEDT